MKNVNNKQRSTLKELSIIVLATLMVDAFTMANAERPPRPPMDEKTQAAFETCISENNLPSPGDGQRPSSEQMQTLHACLESKGITPPPHHRRPLPPESSPETETSSGLGDGDGTSTVPDGVESVSH